MDQVKPIARKLMAVKLIQTKWRAFAAQREFYICLKLHYTAMTVQRYWRGCRDRLVYDTLKRAAVLLQSRFRGHNVRKKNGKWQASAIALQRIWRGFSAQVNYHVDLSDIVEVQSVVRRRAAALHYRRKLAALLLLQRTLRRFLALRTADAKRTERAMNTRWTKSVVLCQVSPCFSLYSRSIQLLLTSFLCAVSLECRTSPPWDTLRPATGSTEFIFETCSDLLEEIPHTMCVQTDTLACRYGTITDSRILRTTAHGQAEFQRDNSPVCVAGLFCKRQLPAAVARHYRSAEHS